jgi:hypothetical protein
MNLAHSKGKPGVFPPVATINIRFATPLPIKIPIKRSMKTMAHFSEPLTILPTLFELFERRQMPAFTHASTPAPVATPFADLMLDAKKLEGVLATIEKEQLAPRAPGGTTSANRDDSKKSKFARAELRQIEFCLTAPSAHSVQLAADFTDWEKSAIDLIKAADGIWFTFIPLEPGRYSYRFIVDGQWHDDPHSYQHISNPFGQSNAVKIVL